jgi:crotonobetainyl-CoA:carnitine CoA-transferase CaiB-like acyl-CoA transferase
MMRGEPSGLGPMQGVRVVDFTTNMAGPLATMILGDQGADVIKVESPDGDVIRGIGAATAGMSGYFANLNRSKRSASLDLTNSESRVLIEALLDTADVMVHSYRPDVVRALSLDASRVRAKRPQLIYAEIAGFGSEGPYAGRPAYDHVIQAMSGFAALQTAPGSDEPALVRQGIIDKLTAFATAQAVTAALFERTRTGAGRTIQIRMLDVAIAVLWPDGMMDKTIVAPEQALPAISGSFRATPTKDGYLVLTLVTRRQLNQLLLATGLKEAGAEAETGPRGPGGEELREAVARLARMTTDEAVELLAAHDVPVSPVVRLEDLHRHPQIVASGIIDEFVHPVVGLVRQANPAVRFGDEQASGLRPAARLGEHTEELLRELKGEFV